MIPPTLPKKKKKVSLIANSENLRWSHYILFACMEVSIFSIYMKLYIANIQKLREAHLKGQFTTQWTKISGLKYFLQIVYLFPF